MQEIGDKDSNIFETVHERYEKEAEAGNFERELDCDDTGTGMVNDACEKAVEHNQQNDEYFNRADGTD